MRLGILTLHAQLNYGGVLQAFALQTALRRAGYDAWIVDRWLSPTNGALMGPLTAGGMRRRVGVLLRAYLGLGPGGRLRRHRRTVRFVRGRLRLTREHFTEWSEPAAQSLALDCLVVGSDQVWHCGDWGNPLPYLLKGAPRHLSAIAYAASFGMREIPEGMETPYREGFGRFSAIGVREAEGVRLVGAMGGEAAHVVDPTLLLEPAAWREQVSGRPTRRPVLTVYLLSERIEGVLPELEAFARRRKAEVRVLVNDFARPFPKTPKRVLRQMGWLIHRAMSPVRLCLSAGPQEFLEAFAQSTWVLSDSFHALMFSSIFDRQVAILRPKDASRKTMFARIEEFVTTVTEGPVIEASVKAALERFGRGERMAFRHDVIRSRRETSWAWLRAALGKVRRERAEARRP